MGQAAHLWRWRGLLIVNTRSGNGGRQLNWSARPRAGGLRAAVDGERVELESPVELSIEPRALRILVP
jgi:hypothetical protein